MSARIFSPAKTAMQSGKAKTGHWVLEFEPEQPRKIDPLMGYTTSGDMKSQIRLTFETREEAVAYAEKNGHCLPRQEPKETKRRQISYAENFRYDRKIALDALTGNAGRLARKFCRRLAAGQRSRSSAG